MNLNSGAYVYANVSAKGVSVEVNRRSWTILGSNGFEQRGRNSHSQKGNKYGYKYLPRTLSNADYSCKYLIQFMSRANREFV